MSLSPVSRTIDESYASSDDASTVDDPKDDRLGLSENGALAVSLHGMTSVVRKDLTGLPPMSAAITAAIDDDNELWGIIVGQFLISFSFFTLPSTLFLTPLLLISHQHFRNTQQ